MTDLTAEALEALDVAAQELRAAAPWFDPSASADMMRSANHCEQVAKRIRTGQLIHAVPSDYLTRAHAQIASGQSKENTELDSALIAQPSGDVVEAVARDLFKRAISRGEWDDYHEDVQAEYLATATAAITAYEAASGVAKMREALRPFANVTILPDGSVVGLERHWFTDARAALGEKP